MYIILKHKKGTFIQRNIGQLVLYKHVCIKKIHTILLIRLKMTKFYVFSSSSTLQSTLIETILSGTLHGPLNRGDILSSKYTYNRTIGRARAVTPLSVSLSVSLTAHACSATRAGATADHRGRTKIIARLFIHIENPTWPPSPSLPR